MNKNIKVLHVYKTAAPYTVGGVEQVIHNIAADSRKHGVESIVMCLADTGNGSARKFSGYDVYAAHKVIEVASTGLSLQAISLFRSLVKQVDLIHYHFPWPFMDILELLIKPNLPKVLTYHSDIVRQKYLYKLYRPLMMRFLSDMDCIVATSPNYLATSDVLQAFQKRCEVIPIGISDDYLSIIDDQEVEGIQKKYGKKFFLFIGVLRYYKGLHLLIKAAAINGFPVVIAGAGPTEPELVKQINELGIKNVHLIGEVTNKTKMALLKACTAVVFPSHMRSEAFGVTLVEGAMSSRPLISSEIGTGTTYINVDKVTGLVIPPGDASRLSQAMQALWDDPAKSERFGLEARRRYVNLFTREDMIKKYFAKYHTLLNDKS